MPVDYPLKSAKEKYIRVFVFVNRFTPLNLPVAILQAVFLTLYAVEHRRHDKTLPQGEALFHSDNRSQGWEQALLAAALRVWLASGAGPAGEGEHDWGELYPRAGD